MKPRLALILLVLAATCSACRPTGPIRIHAKYTPTSTLEINGISGALVSTPIKLEGVVDERGLGSDEIGVNREGSEEIKILADSASVVSAVGEGISRNFADSGLRIAENAEVSLRFSIKRFWASEDATYKGEVRLGVEVYRSGTLSGQMIVDGSSSRWGGSLKAENYLEVLSDSLVDALSKLIAMDEFARAVAGEP